MKRVLFLILITNSLASFGQSLDQTFDFANQLYKQKSYQNAVEAYKRVVYFDSTSLYSNQIYPKLLIAYLTLKNIKNLLTIMI
jgi:lipopolysaccharide biosynthesis regulator YciM